MTDVNTGTVEVQDSILASTKKLLGLDDSYDAFDVDITMHINSAIASLIQIGIGPVNGFSIAGRETTWTDLLGVDPNLNAVQSYVYFRVRLAFDPPATSFAISAIQDQIKELSYRLNVYRETNTIDSSGRVVLDAGSL